MSSALFIDGLPLSATPRLACNKALTALPVRLRCCADLPEQLRACGVGKEELPRLGQVAAEQWTGGFNSRPVDAAQFQDLYRAAF